MNDGIRKCNDVKVTERLIYINLWMAKLHKETELAKLYAMIFKYLTLFGGHKKIPPKRQVSISFPFSPPTLHLRSLAKS